MIDELNEALIQMDARNMNDNVIFYNIPEKEQKSTMQIAKDLLIKDLKIPEHKHASITFQIIHRMGKNLLRPETLLANVMKNLLFFNIIIFQHKYRKKITVSHQLPCELFQ